MHWSTAGNIHGAQLVEESVLAPHPTSGDAVHSGVQEGEQAVCLKVAAGRIYNKLVPKCLILFGGRTRHA